MDSCNTKKIFSCPQSSIVSHKHWLITLLLTVLTTSFQVLADPAPAAAESPYLRIEAGEHTAVSYTHLDVYKRQDLQLYSRVRCN